MFDANTADWAVNANAPAAADGLHSALTIRGYDDTIEEGAGFALVTVPTGAVSVVFTTYGRAETAPGVASTVGRKLYFRDVQSLLGPWSSRVLTDAPIPTNTAFQKISVTLSLASFVPALLPGETYQFELTRVAPTAGVNLVGDWDLLLASMLFA